MTARNDITGDSIATRKTNDAYRNGWDRIFKNQVKEEREANGSECVEKQSVKDDTDEK